MNQTANKLFPVFLKLENFRVLIVGGGKVALEKINSVWQNSPATKIILVAEKISDEIKTLTNQHPNFIIYNRSFIFDDLNAIDFVIIAVNDKIVSHKIKQAATEKNILTNVADTPEQCDFYLGSIVQKGNVKIAISTNGKSPTMAKRIKETLQENIPEEIDESVENLSKLRTHLKGDFSKKVKALNKITSTFSAEATRKNSVKAKRKRIIVFSAIGIILLIAGYISSFYLSPKTIQVAVHQIDFSQWKFALIGFAAEIINGTLGMAYGLTTTTLLLSSGVAPALTLILVHILEVFTAGSTGLIHYKLGNVNKKLFRNLLLPGILGTLIGTFVVFAFKQYQYIIKPAIATYTLALGFVIIYRSFIKKRKSKRKIKKLFPLGIIAGFLDAVGGGGWATIVSSTLIAGGRNARYTIGSVILSRFFVASVCSISLIFLIGFTNWTILVWLVIGGLAGSPFGPYLIKYIPVKIMTKIVAIVIIILSLKQIFF